MDLRNLQLPLRRAASITCMQDNPHAWQPPSAQSHAHAPHATTGWHPPPHPVNMHTPAQAVRPPAGHRRTRVPLGGRTLAQLTAGSHCSPGRPRPAACAQHQMLQHPAPAVGCSGPGSPSVSCGMGRQAGRQAAWVIYATGMRALLGQMHSHLPAQSHPPLLCSRGCVGHVRSIPAHHSDASLSSPPRQVVLTRVQRSLSREVSRQEVFLGCSTAPGGPTLRESPTKCHVQAGMWGNTQVQQQQLLQSSRV
ncbi:MAG: hypothetical protein WDW38_005523 [Sanguina aurantia]